MNVPPILEHVRKHWESIKGNSPIYAFLLDEIEIHTATNGSIAATVKLGKNHINSKGTLHGAVSSCLTDWAGGMAIASTGLEMTGVSTDMHTSFIGQAREGDVILVTGRADKVGRTLAFTTIEINKVGDDGSKTLIATGKHTKFVKT